MVGGKKCRCYGESKSSKASHDRTPKGKKAANVVGNAYESTPTKHTNGPTKGSPKGM
jgi:hypothetical protein